MLMRRVTPARSITAESPEADCRRQPLLPMPSPTRALVELPPTWKMADPGLPGICTTPSNSGRLPPLAAPLLLLAATLALAGTAVHAEQFFRIGTGGTAGTYYPVGGMIANAISTFPATTC